MADDDKKFLEALKRIRDAEEKLENKRKFDQTLDLIVNLKEFDVRRYSFNTFVQLPHKIKDKKVAGFLEKDSKLVKSIKKDHFPRYKDKKDIKKLLRDHDNFIANAKLMPAVATAFGRVLGPAGKMPSPQLGIITSEDDKIIQDLIRKINASVRIIVKEPSIKIGVAKQSSKNADIVDNIASAYKKIVDNLPKGKDNVKNVKIKFTMGKPVKVEL